MGLFCVTGSASGIGEATVELLTLAGHDVITVDLRDADVTADLSSHDGVAAALSAVAARAARAPSRAGSGGLDVSTSCGLEAEP